MKFKIGQNILCIHELGKDAPKINEECEVSGHHYKNDGLYYIIKNYEKDENGNPQAFIHEAFGVLLKIV